MGLRPSRRFQRSHPRPAESVDDQSSSANDVRSADLLDPRRLRFLSLEANVLVSKKHNVFYYWETCRHQARECYAKALMDQAEAEQMQMGEKVRLFDETRLKARSRGVAHHMIIRSERLEQGLKTHFVAPRL